MAVREFTDGKGREWRVWDVTPDELNPRTKDETYLAQLYHTGWIVFETKSADDKRRLYPIPKGWSELADPELELLLQRAEAVPSQKLRAEKLAKGRAAAESLERALDFGGHTVDEPERARRTARGETPDVTDLSVQRTFRYPGGRIWVVCVIMHPEGGGSPVLRFTAGARSIDLVEWPKDWADYPDEELVMLLREAAPRTAAGALSAATPRRRWNDQPQP